MLWCVRTELVGNHWLREVWHAHLLEMYVCIFSDSCAKEVCFLLFALFFRHSVQRVVDHTGVYILWEGFLGTFQEVSFRVLFCLFLRQWCTIVVRHLWRTPANAAIVLRISLQIYVVWCGMLPSKLYLVTGCNGISVPSELPPCRTPYIIPLQHP